jgi:hypothetical protein
VWRWVMRWDIALLRASAGVAVIATVWACELEDDPPTLVPLDQADEAIEKAYCERMFDCRCDQGRRFDEIAACREWVDERVAQLRDEAEQTGLAYDPACLGITVDRLDDLGCAASFGDDDDDDTCTAPCFPLHGDVPVGGQCERADYGGYSNCAQGLECDIDECFDGETCTGLCENPCFGECDEDCGDDARCNEGTCVPLPGIGQQCSEYGCASGLACRYDELDAQCVRLPELGDDCTDLGQCAEDLRCDRDPMTGEGTCIGPTKLGDACMGHQECASGFCPAGFCDDLPAKGESCAGTNACREGLDCDGESQTCVTGDAILCQLSIDID